MATTTNYGWTTPNDTDLVKDGAAAIRTLGSSVDTTTKALNPSTTLGDIEYRSSTANTNTRLGIGTTGQVLAVSGGVPAWTTPASGGSMTTLASGSLSGASLDLTSISGEYEDLRLILRNFSLTGGPYSGGDNLRLTVNNTANIYFATSTSNSGALTGVFNLGNANVVGAGDGDNTFVLDFLDYSNTLTVKYIATKYAFENTAGNSYFVGQDNGAADLPGAINRITISNLDTGTFDLGTYELFGVK